MQATHSWRRELVVAAAVVAALVGLWALTSEPAAEPARLLVQSPATPPAPLDPAPAPVGSPAPKASEATRGAAIAGEPPPGVSREQWAAIAAEIGRRPDAPAELQRLRAYLEWSDELRRFREARQAGTSAADLAALAQTLDRGLAERLRLAEVSAAEARQIKGAVLEATLPDEAQRVEQLRQWAASELAVPAADPRQASFERRQVEIVAAWQAQPAAARDRAALERELEALRQQSFSSAGPR